MVLKVIQILTDDVLTGSFLANICQKQLQNVYQPSSPPAVQKCKMGVLGFVNTTLIVIVCTYIGANSVILITFQNN